MQRMRLSSSSSSKRKTGDQKDKDYYSTHEPSAVTVYDRSPAKKAAAGMSTTSHQEKEDDRKKKKLAVVGGRDRISDSPGYRMQKPERYRHTPYYDLGSGGTRFPGRSGHHSAYAPRHQHVLGFYHPFEVSPFLLLQPLPPRTPLPQERLLTCECSHRVRQGRCRMGEQAALHAMASTRSDDRKMPASQLAIESMSGEDRRKQEECAQERLSLAGGCPGGSRCQTGIHWHTHGEIATGVLKEHRPPPMRDWSGCGKGHGCIKHGKLLGSCPHGR